jgi:hypothetical protein
MVETARCRFFGGRAAESHRDRRQGDHHRRAAKPPIVSLILGFTWVLAATALRG